MVKTVFEDLEKVVPEIRIKQMVRKIGPMESTTGAKPAQEIDAEISSWINNGWKLFATHYAGSEPDGVTIVYILTKD